jgi:hypothetical protein
VSEEWISQCPSSKKKDTLIVQCYKTFFYLIFTYIVCYLLLLTSSS